MGTKIPGGVKSIFLSPANLTSGATWEGQDGYWPNLGLTWVVSNYIQTHTLSDFHEKNTHPNQTQVTNPLFKYNSGWV